MKMVVMNFYLLLVIYVLTFSILRDMEKKGSAKRDTFACVFGALTVVLFVGGAARTLGDFTVYAFTSYVDWGAR
jgi:hypothetical protein